MVLNLKTKSTAKYLTENGRLIIQHQDYPELKNLRISDLVCQKTTVFFKLLGLDISFMDEPVSNWTNITAYQQSKVFLQNIKVVNDVAERAVRLVQDYNKKNWTDEQKFQDMLRTVARYRRSRSGLAD